MAAEVRIFPIGDSALTIEFGSTISPGLNAGAITLSERLTQNPFPGFIESVPAYASTSVYYDPIMAARSFGGSPFDHVRRIILKLLETTASEHIVDRIIEIPVRFDGPDLEFVAQTHGLSAADVIEIFVSRSYRVYMLGFLPGFTYMGDVDERIATPRHDSPRTLVEKGSVGIAGRQTGIYSLDSPGGWQIIGVTDVDIFTPNGNSPTLLRPGDQVTFVRAK